MSPKTKPVAKDNPDLDRAITRLSDAHLTCRDLGHRWALKTHHSRLVETLAEKHVAVVERIVRCTVCNTKRTEQVRRSDGVLIRRVYEYPNGYCFEPGVTGQGGMAKSPFRTEWIRRSVSGPAKKTP